MELATYHLENFTINGGQSATSFTAKLCSVIRTYVKIKGSVHTIGGYTGDQGRVSTAEGQW